MTRKYIDNALISIGCILMLASFWFFSTGKKKRSDFRNIVAQIKFLKKSVKTKMTGSVEWYTGQEEEKINAYGLGFTGKESSARYLYLNKFQIISLDDSLIEFLPTDELQVNKGKFMVLNPDGGLKIADKNGNSQIVKPGMLYETTQKGLVETPTKWKKSWIAEGEPYSLILKDNVITEYFLLSPPTLTVDRFGTTCIGKLKPIESDAGDVRYQIRANGQDLILTNMQVNLPTKKSLIELRSVADSVNSVWREVALPSHCITEPEPVIIPEPIPEPVPLPVPEPVIRKENLAFWNRSKETIYLDNNEDKHSVVAYFLVNSKAKFEVNGPKIKTKSMIEGDFKKKYLLGPGLYNFKLTKDGRILNKTINVEIKPPFKIKNSIFIEQ